MINTLSRYLLVVLLAIGVLPVIAQQAVPLPDWLVPVVRVLPGDRVIPSTGVYLGGERVLVPSELTGAGGTLLVLDGGADLARFGRAAEIEQRFNVQGLAILRVTGLQRTPPRLGSLRDLAGSDIALQAYPPAAQIAAGQGSLLVRSSLVKGQGVWSLAADRPLPNVTGALTDACGNWVGHSAARGAAMMGSSQSTQYRFTDGLQPLLEQIGVQLQQATCDRAWPEPVQDMPVTEVIPEPMPEPEPEPEPEPAAPSEPVPANPPETETEPETEAAGDSGAQEEAESTPDPEVFESEEPPPETPADKPVETPTELSEDHASAWSWWVVLPVSLLALALIVYLRRRSKQNAVETMVQGDIPVAGSDSKPLACLVSPQDQHVLVATHGQLNVLIGRFDADVLLRSSSASRQHARLHGPANALLLEDLGSSNGTFHNGVRCEPFEPVNVAFGDELMFADERYRLELPAQEDPS